METLAWSRAKSAESELWPVLVEAEGRVYEGVAGGGGTLCVDAGGVYGAGGGGGVLYEDAGGGELYADAGGGL